jgi:tetratricopeptide (TPR) repeat protein
MPAHVYIRTGDFDAATRTNVDAAKADETYIQASGVQGIYPLMYYSHNLHFIAMASSMAGRYADSKAAADKLAAHVGPAVKDIPPLGGFMTVPIAVRVRFQKWDEILAMPAPDESMKAAGVYWHFARGMALAAKGKVSDAEAEQKIVAEAERNTPPDEIFAMPVNNKTKVVLTVAENALAAKIAMAKHDTKGAIAKLRDAVAAQDQLKYNEPQDWFYPVRESLGAALLMDGDAAGAEKVFREDLDRNPRNPRSLFGLREALKAQKRDYDAGFVDKQFQDAWAKADAALRLEDMV